LNYIYLGKNNTITPFKNKKNNVITSMLQETSLTLVVEIKISNFHPNLYPHARGGQICYQTKKMTGRKSSCLGEKIRKGYGVPYAPDKYCSSLLDLQLVDLGWTDGRREEPGRRDSSYPLANHKAWLLNALLQVNDPESRSPYRDLAIRLSDN
jgi:hypothetical protein